ncbi:hypothetical protein [Rhodanobacter sp. BL-MT-08]
MSAHPQAVRRPDNVVRIGRARAAERNWPQQAERRLAYVKPPKPTRGDRFAAVAWNLHDGMPLLWVLLFALFLMASAGISVLLFAFVLGWQP